MKILEVEQGSSEWFQARIGRVTASKISAVMATLKRKDGEAAVRRDYKYQLLAEILTGQLIEEGYVSPAMERGTQLEPLGLASYEVTTGNVVDRVGFAFHPTIVRAGASPDGIINPDGLVELKCPNVTTHLSYLEAGVVPSEYHDQMFWQMACCERQWADFCSYDPRLPEHLQLFIRRLPRDETRIAELTVGVEKFLGEIDGILARLPKATRGSDGVH